MTTMTDLLAARARPRADGRPRWEPPGERTGTYLVILAVVVVLNMFGLIMVLSASSVVSHDETGSTWSYFERQSMWAAIGSLNRSSAWRLTSVPPRSVSSTIPPPRPSSAKWRGADTRCR